MKAKQRSVCDNCRLRKLGGDGRHPGCCQCTLTERKCPGYPQQWTFVQQSILPAETHRLNQRHQLQSNDEQMKEPICPILSTKTPYHHSNNIQTHDVNILDEHCHHELSSASSHVLID